jgi:hypothetical protein
MILFQPMICEYAAVCNDGESLTRARNDRLGLALLAMTKWVRVSGESGGFTLTPTFSHRGRGGRDERGMACRWFGANR